jgi:hypothetical protein
MIWDLLLEILLQEAIARVLQTSSIRDFMWILNPKKYGVEMTMMII